MNRIFNLGAIALVSLGMLLTTSCSQDNAGNSDQQNTNTSAEAVSDKGVGPVKSVTLSDEIDPTLVEQGKNIFSSKCSACHKIAERYVGPPVEGITSRRKPEWIMNMILNSAEMVQKDPVAKQLLAEYMTPMPFQDVTEAEARAILEYFRSIDQEI